MFYDYKILDINNRGQMFDILELSSDSKRCRIQRKDLETVFKDSKVGLDKLGHGQKTCDIIWDIFWSWTI